MEIAIQTIHVILSSPQLSGASRTTARKIPCTTTAVAATKTTAIAATTTEAAVAVIQTERENNKAYHNFDEKYQNDIIATVTMPSAFNIKTPYSNNKTSPLLQK